MDTAAQKLIDKQGLIPHPEGGWYQEVYRSGQSVLSSSAEARRAAVTHIYFLLAQGQVSRFHRVVHDEIWNFYAGAPLRLVILSGSDAEEKIIGANCSNYAAVIPGGMYQAAESTGAYSLVGCTVAPGFEFEDFSFLTDQPEAVDWMSRLSQYRRFI